MIADSFAVSEGFIDRLQVLVNGVGVSQRQLALKAKVDPGTVTRWRTKNTPPSFESVMKISKVWKCSFDWLAYGEGEPFPPPTENPGKKSKLAEIVQIPVLGRVPAGIPNTLEEFTDEYISLPNVPKNCFALKVAGESMEPAFKHGDYVLFVIDQDIKNGDVVIVNDEFGESMVKRYKEKDKEQFLVSDNPAYPTYKPNGAYRIMGKVIGAWRQLNV